MKPYYEHAGITIYHGDCREILLHLTADVVIADPPYGVNLGERTGTSRYRNERYISIEDTEEYVQRVCVPAIEDCVAMFSRVAMTPGNRCMWLYPKPDDVGIWYNPCSTNRGRWGFSHANAFIFYYGKDPRNIGKGMIPNSLSGACDSVAGIDHPCPKPLRFMRWLVDRSSLEGETVLDPFMGSGTTLLAAKNLGRKAIGIEVEEKYCEVAAKRLAQEVLFGNPSLSTPSRTLPPTGVLQPAELIHGEANPEAPIAPLLESELKGDAGVVGAVLPGALEDGQNLLPELEGAGPHRDEDVLLVEADDPASPPMEAHLHPVAGGVGTRVAEEGKHRRSLGEDPEDAQKGPRGGGDRSVDAQGSLR